jgi:hypothetical protein
MWDGASVPFNRVFVSAPRHKNSYSLSGLSRPNGLMKLTSLAPLATPLCSAPCSPGRSAGSPAPRGVRLISRPATPSLSTPGTHDEPHPIDSDDKAMRRLIVALIISLLLVHPVIVLRLED